MYYQYVCFFNFYAEAVVHATNSMFRVEGLWYDFPESNIDFILKLKFDRTEISLALPSVWNLFFCKESLGNIPSPVL